MKMVYAGMRSALESAYLVGSKVVDTIVANWSQYKSTMPYEVKGNIDEVSQQQLTQSNESSASINKISSITDSENLLTANHWLKP